MQDLKISFSAAMTALVLSLICLIGIPMLVTHVSSVGGIAGSLFCATFIACLLLLNKQSIKQLREHNKGLIVFIENPLNLDHPRSRSYGKVTGDFIKVGLYLSFLMAIAEAIF